MPRFGMESFDGQYGNVDGAVSHDMRMLYLVEGVSFPLFPSLTELPLGPEFLYGFGWQ